MRSGRLKLALCLTLLTYPGATAAQRLPERRWNAYATALAEGPREIREGWAAAAVALGRAPDYRWEGLVIGAVAVGAAGALLGNEFCSFDGVNQGSCLGRTVAWAVAGATAGAVVGGLIGGLIPKTPAATEQEP